VFCVSFKSLGCFVAKTLYGHELQRVMTLQKTLHVARFALTSAQRLEREREREIERERESDLPISMQRLPNTQWNTS
jgi:hypothetical protein